MFGVPSAAEGMLMQLVAVVALAAWVWSFWRRVTVGGGYRWGPCAGQRVPTDAEIEARVTRLAALGELPAGWARRDVERLLRIEARRRRA